MPLYQLTYYKVVDFSVAHLQLLSDHCPIVFAVAAPCTSLSQPQSVIKESTHQLITDATKMAKRGFREGIK